MENQHFMNKSLYGEPKALRTGYIIFCFQKKDLSAFGLNFICQIKNKANCDRIRIRINGDQIENTVTISVSIYNKNLLVNICNSC